MGKKYKSPSKLRRDIFRVLEYKIAYLEDCWDTDVEIDRNSNDIVWNASKYLKLTLEKRTKIVETRKFYNPSFSTSRFQEKLALFQNMWKPDHQSFNFFSCMHHHLKRNSSQCDNFCTKFSSPYCGRLTFFLSTNNWPNN
jgi:hypothetical protein